MHYGHRSSLLSPLLNQNSLPNPIHNSNSRISQFKVVRYRFNPALSPKFMVVYMVFSNLIGQLRPCLPENTRSPEVKLVRALLVLRFVRVNIFLRRWRCSRLDFQHRTGPPPIRIPLFANQSRLKSKTYLDSPESRPLTLLNSQSTQTSWESIPGTSSSKCSTWESRGAVVFFDHFCSYFCRFLTFVLKSQGNWSL